MEENQPKRSYSPPAIAHFVLQMECGIAAGSATLKPGDSGTPDIPKIDDWQDTGNTSTDYDF
ncbi:hypothetical protein [Sphingobacterium suaedae]|uniref:Uncharacterized protein n=1 Tax=Sphingobacterium suaedae TaxID=1686402 RepID=A0ABW5KML3_9SPHI